MKSRLFFGMFCIMIIFVFSFVSCDNGSTGDANGANPFYGKWSGTIQSLGPVQGQTIILECFNHDWNYIANNNYWQKGTYTYSGNSATMIITHQTFDGISWSEDLSGLPFTEFSATVNGNIMTASGETLTKHL